MKRPRPPKTKTAGSEPPPKPSSRRAELASEASANPFRFFNAEETGEIFDLGRNVMTALRAMGAPVIGRKMNPHLLMQWLKENHERVPKAREDEEEE